MARLPSPSWAPHSRGQGELELSPGEALGPDGGGSWHSLLGPLQKFCCVRGGEASEANDVFDTPLIPSRLHFGEEETVSMSSVPSLNAALCEPPELVERGELVLEDGASYRGQWRGKHRHGSGVLSRPSGFTYEGSFERSRCHGHGVWRNPDGGSYEGQWERDHKHGYGKYCHADGTAYEGEWQADHKSGRGCERWADGAKYAGEFRKGRKHGVGIYVGRDKSEKEWRYEGQWVQDQMDGEGCYTFSDGRYYCGQWQAGFMAGVGRMDFPDGSRYEGNYDRGVKHGSGVFTTTAGVVITGQWCRGKMVGGEGVAAAGAGGAKGALVPGRKGRGARALGGA